jgi:hypothetical protein
MRSVLATVALAGAALHAQTAAPHLPPLDRALPARVEAIYQTVSPRVDTGAAMEAVRFIGPQWRLAGNPAFEQSQQYVFDRLKAGGLSPRFESFIDGGLGWEQRRGTLRLDDARGEVLLSMETHRVALAINSHATAPGGAIYRLVDAGRGANGADYEVNDVRGAVVLADAPIGTMWNHAVKARGAAGVISTAVAAYTRPAETPDVLQWGSIPYSGAPASFGFKATPRAAARLRERLASGPLMVHVDVDAVFHRRQNRTLIAEIAGATAAQDRVVLVAHVQEPGANDNASGTATLMSAALALQAAVAGGALPRPARTITFLWVDENRGSDQWIREDPARVRRVLAMMSLDMTGEDTARTGGTFLIEKGPDPSAIWPRPSDPHSEWGAGKVDPALVKGTFLNDLHLAVCLRRARDTGWVVRTNPYEGGSDHTSFTRAGVPALLNWHFTDRYYHTNLDTIDKVSAATMGHVAVSVGTTAAYLASAGAADVEAMTRFLQTAFDARMATERANGATDEILDAWRVWYKEALASVERFKL